MASGSDPTEPPGRNLDHYIEAQVHGDVALGEDVEALVADPSFRSSDTGRVLEQLVERYDIELRWHPGFALRVDEVPSDFRGPRMPSLAARITTGSHVDAATIGHAARSLKRDPSAWASRGTYDEVLQELKLLWHVLVRFGHPSSAVAGPRGRAPLR